MTDRMEGQMTPEDVVLFLFAGNSTSGSYINAVNSRIHKTVYELRKKDPDIFEDFVFNTNRLYPYCEVLDESIDKLKWYRLVGMQNPDFRVYFIKDNAHDVLENEVKPHLKDDVIERLTKASAYFWAQLAEGN